MKFLKLKNFLLLGATGISILLAAVLLGAGQPVFSGLFLGGGILFFYLWLKSKKVAREDVTPTLPKILFPNLHTLYQN